MQQVSVKLEDICSWGWHALETGPGPGWVCTHGFFMASPDLPDHMLALQKYHDAYMKRQRELGVEKTMLVAQS